MSDALAVDSASVAADAVLAELDRAPTHAMRG
jgi:hypothetical protein